MSSDTRSAGFDALRVCAAALVLVAHGAGFLFPLWPHYQAYLGIGWIGIELFFGLSGFLLVHGLLAALPENGNAAGAVVLRRVRRIMPWYAVFLLLAVLLWYWHYRRLPEGLAAYPLLLQNTLWQHPAFFGEAWNLPILMLFAVIAPMLALFAARTADPRLTFALGLVVLLVLGLALRMLAVRYGSPSWDEGIRKFLPARWDACAWGGLAACSLAWVRTRSRQALLASTGGVLLLLTVIVFAQSALDDSTLARTVLFSAIGLAIALPLPWLFGLGTSGPALRFAALATWPLYFVNLPLVLLADWNGWIPREPSAWSLGAFAVWLAISVLLAAVLQRLVRAR